MWPLGGGHLSGGGGQASSPRAAGVELETVGRSSSSGSTERSIPLARGELGPLLCLPRASLASGGATQASFPGVSGAVPARPPSAGGDCGPGVAQVGHVLCVLFGLRACVLCRVFPALSWAVLSCKSLPSLCPCWTPASPHSCVAAVSPLGTEGSDWLALLPPWPSGGSCGEDLGRRVCVLGSRGLTTGQFLP